MSQKVTLLSHKSPKALVDKLSAAVGSCCIELLGQCTALFDGRIKSVLAPGDRFLVVKNDSSVLLHAPKGVKPLNWQKGGAGKVEFRLDTSGKLEVYSFRPKTEESFSIVFDRVDLALTYDASDAASLQVEGHEKDLVDYLVRNTAVIGDDLTLTGREVETQVGFIDLLATDQAGHICIIEVKKQAANPADAHQLLRYVQYWSENYHTPLSSLRGILVSAKTPEKVGAYLQEHNLESCDVAWQDIFPNIKRGRTKSLADFF